MLPKEGRGQPEISPGQNLKKNTPAGLKTDDMRLPSELMSLWEEVKAKGMGDWDLEKEGSEK